VPSFPDLLAPISDGVVSLRRFTQDDVADVTRALQDPEIVRWTASIPSPYSQEDASTWIGRHPQNWDTGFTASLAICHAEDGAFLGCVNVIVPSEANGRVAMGYWVAAWCRGVGVATRALVLATQWAIDVLDPPELYLTTIDGNVASERVAEKAGYVFLSSTSRDLVRRWSGTTDVVQMNEWVRRRT
jgi:ribosomal-protein-alanine N-acetyltransferase